MFINKLLFGFIQGGCCSLCHLGASHLSILRVFSGFLVLQAVTTRIHLDMCHVDATNLHEGHKASEVSQKEEAKDASSAIYVKLQRHHPHMRSCNLFLLLSHKTHLLVLRADPVTRLMDEDDSYAHGTGRVRPGWLSRAISGF